MYVRDMRTAAPELLLIAVDSGYLLLLGVGLPETGLRAPAGRMLAKAGRHNL